jgi:hypothetical protein
VGECEGKIAYRNGHVDDVEERSDDLSLWRDSPDRSRQLPLVRFVPKGAKAGAPTRAHSHNPESLTPDRLPGNSQKRSLVTPTGHPALLPDPSSVPLHGPPGEVQTDRPLVPRGPESEVFVEDGKEEEEDQGR